MKTTFSNWPNAVAKIAGGCVLVAGVVVLTGWCFDVSLLKSILPDWPKMSPLTAVSFVLGGFSLWCAVSATQRKTGLIRVSQICAAIIFFIALFRLSDYLFGWNLNFDTLGFHESSGIVSPAQMSRATALDFLLLGGALLLAGGSRLIGIFQFLTLSAGLLSWLGFSHFVFGDAPVPLFAHMAIHTAVLFLLLGAGIFCTRTDGGLMKLLVSDSAGGLLARRLLPSALIFLFALNWLESWVDRHDWFSSGAESSLFMLNDIIIFGALVWFNAALLHRADMKRRRAEEMRTRLGNIVESSDDAIIGKTLDGVITSWNRGAEKVFGYTAQEAIGKPMLMLFPPERVNEESEILARIGRGENVESFETVRIRKDKRQIYVSATISPVKDSSGKIVGASKIARDITARKRAEEALQQSQNHLRIVTENARVGLVMVNRERRYTFANGAYAEMLGLPSANITGQSIADVLAPLYEEQIRPRLDRAFNGERVAYELHKPMPDGDCFYAVKYEPTKVDGSVSLVVVVITDITDQKRAQEELIWKTAFLEAQVDSALDAILVVNDRAKIILKNQRLAQLFKIPDEIVRDDNDNKLLQYVTGRMKDPKQFLERVQYLYEHPDEISRDEIELVDRTILDRYSSPVRDKAGKHYGRIWAFRDITEQRKLEGQFRQSQKMESIGQLASGVAHDFNNILAIIQIQADLLKAEGGLSPAQTEFVGEIGEASQRAAALTRQLLLFSRKEKLQPRDLDLNVSIGDMTKMLRRTLGEDIQLQFKFAMQPIFVHADPNMMDQVLMNLAVNSRDAMPKGGKLIIETSAVEFNESAASHSGQIRPGKFVCLGVSDTGCGIPRENLQKIFEPFFTTKEIGKGTGLGLATVFGIVQQHQGWVNVYSEVGQGTTFRIYLPLLARTSDQKFVAPMTEKARGGGETILLVEDEPRLRASVQNILSRLGYRVLEAANGVEALEVWNQQRDEIHLLLTDMVMPGGMTGKDLGERLLKKNPKLKVIYASGYSAEVAGKDFPLEEGVNFLTKPFQAQKLAQTIRNSLDRQTTARTE
jgi:PAS domain S-box-containing protein